MTGSLPSEAYAAAIAGTDGMTPHRLTLLLRRHRPEEAWAVLRGEVDDRLFAADLERSAWLRRGVGRSVTNDAPARAWERCLTTGTRVLPLGSPGYPPVLAADRSAPAVLFVRGDVAALEHRRVGMVGTRNATEGGRRLAARLGRELAEAEVSVVSGLARGIDGSAHRGVLAGDGGAPPIAVVASGPDVPFPREHTSLWGRVIERGLLLSEHPPGTPPMATSFPARNRILAALSEVLVVVESRAKGGSMITVNEAQLRQIEVLAVPGSLLNRAADGTNGLIAQGAIPVLGSDDVLVALGLDHRRAGATAFDSRPPPNTGDRAVLDAMAGDALTVDEVMGRTGLPLADAALALGRLEAGGWVVRAGGWFEPVPPDTFEPSTRSAAQKGCRG
jgi:DNA processing protein